MLYKEGKSALSRRAFIGKLTASAAVTVAACAGQAKALSARGQSLLGSETPTGTLNGENTIALGPQEPPDRPVVQAAAEAQLPAAGESNAPAPWKLLSPLAMGSAVGHGWRVAGLSGVEDGSCVLTLQNERGRTHRVHLCRNDGRPQGLVYTEQLDLVLMNGGVGDLPTEEGLAQAVARVAHVLAANEGDRRHTSVVTALLPQAERVSLFSAAAALR